MKKVIVAGSINMDIVAFTQRHPKTGETVFGTDLKYFPGGKGANQAVSSAKLGADTVMIGKVGGDSFGQQLTTFLENQGVKNEITYENNSPTGTALITVSTETSDNTIVVVPGANFKLIQDDLKTVDLNIGDVLVSQFEIPIEIIKFFFENGKKAGTINILNPAPAKEIDSELLKLIDILILNESELELLSAIKVDVADENSISDAVNKIKLPGQTIIVTLGDKGALGFIKDKIVKIEGRKVKAVDTTGAGDCFVGAIASKISKGSSVEEAIEFANIAASLCVTKLGASPSMPTISEVNAINSNK